MSMDCETCKPTLLDLIHGELDPTLAAQARQHMEGCASCRAEMERLTVGLQLARQLPVVDVPNLLTERVMALATSHAERVRGAQAPLRRSLWQRLLDFVGEFAMTPQVGMATISLLIVAVGLWSVPRLTREPQAAGVTVVNPDPDGQAGPSATLQPAERLELAVDTRGKRIRSREEAEELGRRAEVAAPGGAAAEVAAVPEASEASAPRDVAQEPTLQEWELAVGAAAAEEAALPGDELKAREVPSRPVPESARRAKGKASPKALDVDTFAQAEVVDSYEGGAASGQGMASAERFAPPPPAPSAAAAPATRSAAGSDGLTAGGAAAPAKDDATPARKAAPAEPTREGSASGALSMARASQASSGCRAALPGYERLITAFPSSPEAGEAMLAAAACYRSLGQESLARELLRRAMQRPATAARARAMLADEPATAPAAEAGEPKK